LRLGTGAQKELDARLLVLAAKVAFAVAGLLSAFGQAVGRYPGLRCHGYSVTSMAAGSKPEMARCRVWALRLAGHGGAFRQSSQGSHMQKQVEIALADPVLAATDKRQVLLDA
jgi:hypothetical protein